MLDATASTHAMSTGTPCGLGLGVFQANNITDVSAWRDKAIHKKEVVVTLAVGPTAENESRIMSRSSTVGATGE